MNWIDNLSKEVKMVVGAIACLITFGGFLFAGHGYMERYALADELKQTNKRLDQKIMSDELSQTQNRIWLIEDRFRGKALDKTVQEELQSLKEKKEDLKKQLDKK